MIMNKTIVAYNLTLAKPSEICGAIIRGYKLPRKALPHGASLKSFSSIVKNNQKRFNFPADGFRHKTVCALIDRSGKATCPFPHPR